MDPADFICGLMRRNTDAVGFITRPTIEKRFVPKGHYVIQRNRHGQPIGYLLHGPVHPDGTLHVHQACIELDRRNRGFGHQAVRTLIERAIRHHARTILLRCAADLEATTFWTACGFLPFALSPGGKRRQRTILHFSLELQEGQPAVNGFSDSGPHPASLRPKA